MSKDDSTVTALWRQLPGHRLEGATAGWYEREGHRNPHPLIWLHVDGVGSLEVGCAGDGSLSLSLSNPDDSYEMPELGARVVVEPVSYDFPLSTFIGLEVTGVRELFHHGLDTSVGILLEFASGAVGLANVADEVVVCGWPAPEWIGWSVA